MTGRSTPHLLRKLVCSLVLVSLLSLSAAALHAKVEEGKAGAIGKVVYNDGELERIFTNAQQRWGAALYDGSSTYEFNSIQIAGNKLLSDEMLFRNLPVIFETEVLEDKKPQRRLYDFRVLHQLLDRPRLRKVSQRTMEGLTRYILEQYQAHGYAGVYVYVRSESLYGGPGPLARPLQLMVLEGRIADIEVVRYNFKGEPQQKGFLRSSLLNAWSPIQVGDVIQKKELDTFVELLNRNPDRQMRVVVSGSEEPNALDLRFDLYENNPWHFYMQVDSSGIEERQWNPRIGLLNTNLTGRDDTLSFMYQLALEQPQKNYASFAAYDIPLFTPRWRMGGYAGYSEYKITPKTSQGIVEFLGDGYFYGAMTRYYLCTFREWVCEAQGTLSNEKSRVNPNVGINSEVDLYMLGVGVDATRRKSLTLSSLGLNLQRHLGGSDVSEFQDARKGSKPHFARVTASAAHRHYLAASRIHQVRGRLSGIYSDRRLVPAKMTTFGGLHSVRGYREDEIVADGGIMAALEYGINLSRAWGWDVIQDKGENKRFDFNPRDPNSYDITLLGFTDYGHARNKHFIAGEVEAQDLWSAGVGVEVDGGRNVSLRSYLGVALLDTKSGTGNKLTRAGDVRWSFSLLLRY